MITFAAVAALLSCTGCIITASTYDAKVREVEALRDAYALSNRDTSRLAGEVETLSKQVAAQKAAGEDLAWQLREKEESLKRLRGELEAVRKASEGSRFTRDQFIEELLAKEKSTGKRLQELSSRADACAEELAELRRKLEMKEGPTGR
jgi:predicted RNase H-like nuclease (RuvC/YqgF family)